MAENIKGWQRTSRCAEIDQGALGEEMILMGWCHKQRDLGGLVFITLRDRSGEIQLLIDESCPAAAREKAALVRSYCRTRCPAKKKFTQSRDAYRKC